MSTIWKFQIKVEDIQRVKMPEGATIICVQTQKGEPCLWAQVDTQRPLVERSIVTYGTGRPCKIAASGYIGTYQLYGGDLVFHVFEG